MKDLFVTYEIALLLKEKGFDEPCVFYLNKENKVFVYNFQDDIREFINWCCCDVIKAPTIQQAIDFVETKLEGWVHIYYNDVVCKWGWGVFPLDERNNWRIEDEYFEGNRIYGKGTMNSKREAIDKAIEEAIKHIE